MCDNTLCESTRLLSIHGKCNDLANVAYAHIDIDGYLPNLPNITDGDINFTVCMQCGKIQGTFPITDEVIFDAFSLDEDEDELVYQITEDDVNNMIKELLNTDNEVTDQDLVEYYENTETWDWSIFIKKINRIFNVSITLSSCLFIYKQLPLYLQLLGIVNGVDNDIFLHYVELYVACNKDKIMIS